MKTSIQSIFTLIVIVTVGAAGLMMLADAQHTQHNEPVKPDSQKSTSTTQYQSLATVTPQQARDTAEAEKGDSATEIELDEEAGSLVYEVEFADGTEIIVDAGNNTILKTEHPDGTVQESTTPPRQGSIQIPQDIPTEPNN